MRRQGKAKEAARARFALNAHPATQLPDDLEHDRQAQTVFQKLDVANVVECCEQVFPGCGWRTML